jgi:hypothetical protein
MGNSTNTSGRVRKVRSCLAAVLMLALCAPAPATPADPVAPDRIQVYATEIIQGILQGLAEGDFEKYAIDFDETLRKTVNRETFLQVQKNLRTKVGKFKSIDFLGFYVQEGQAIALFKARFSKEKDDVLVTLVLDPRKSAPKVTGVWFDAPALRE